MKLPALRSVGLARLVEDVHFNSTQAGTAQPRVIRWRYSAWVMGGLIRCADRELEGVWRTEGLRVLSQKERIQACFRLDGVPGREWAHFSLLLAPTILRLGLLGELLGVRGLPSQSAAYAVQCSCFLDEVSVCLAEEILASGNASGMLALRVMQFNQRVSHITMRELVELLKPEEKALEEGREIFFCLVEDDPSRSEKDMVAKAQMALSLVGNGQAEHQRCRLSRLVQGGLFRVGRKSVGRKSVGRK